ncbi:hypothetical protein N3K66_006482 [Trichothecium roseum]|uniref:Uncharacterized protein n=1 Tax=Trichothecium roseum TaxID=47278 RepID=A0ACC0UVI4_9HYPO|nr:hypothetical protein N3K66_006482 [Trichothecium roseum]
MHAPGSRALSTVALATRAPRCRVKVNLDIGGHEKPAQVSTPHRLRISSRSVPRQRCGFHTSSRCASTAAPSPTAPAGTGEGEGRRTPNESTTSFTEQNEAGQADETLVDNEIFGTRTPRLSGSNSIKNRVARKRVQSPLPPVQLPKHFLEENVYVERKLFEHYPLPKALRDDLKGNKIASIANLTDANKNSRQKNTTRARSSIELYFDYALEELLSFENKLFDLFDRDDVSDFLRTEEGVSAVDKYARLQEMIEDVSSHLSEALQPSLGARAEYKARPFWWWNLLRDLDPQTQLFTGSPMAIKRQISQQIATALTFEYPLAHSIADLPVDVFEAILMAVNQDMSIEAPDNLDAKVARRPINILSLSGYSGSAVCESVGKYVAEGANYDLIHINAHDLSYMVGEYLGQDLAYTRGPVSTLGYRVAEINGKVAKEPAIVANTVAEDADDSDSSMFSVRTSGSWEEELQKIKQGSIDCFSKWDQLKIDKILEHIITAADTKRGPEGNMKPVILHIHDFVELSMVLEGSMILSRLRALVDASWHRGRKIVILGTSASKDPSEEYQKMVRELSCTDFVVTRHIDPSRGLKMSPSPKTDKPTTLQQSDFFRENIANINRVIRNLAPGRDIGVINPQSPTRFCNMLRVLGSYKSTSKMDFLSNSIMPLPEVYRIAQSFVARASAESKDTPEKLAVKCIGERLLVNPLRVPPGQDFETEGTYSQKSTETSRSAEDGKTRGGLKLTGLNEYEKRVSSGHIDREKLTVTFDDVHAPKETISALKLLTSLALVRPDAFSYGVLAHDKITGCLLYGPPGTGKTMLAKAVAKESGANMLEISGASINDKWVGEAEKLIRAVFTLAKKLSPCVVFIDEADSLLANRSMFSSRASHREHINQFLKEWDGMEETHAFIMVATNRPFDLDDAVLRRLPRKILVDQPTRDDRAAILRLLLKSEKTDGTVSLDAIADRTPYYSGSDLKNLCVTAAMCAVEEENLDAAAHAGPDPYQYPERRVLTEKHFESALRQVPASISENMASLRLIRRFDEEYGSRRRSGKKGMGFGDIGTKRTGEETKIRPGGL